MVEYRSTLSIRMPFSWSSLHRPVVALAPMAGVTDASYRQIIKRVAPEVVVYTEFLSTNALAFGSERTMKMLDFDPKIERPFIVQIFGSDPVKFLEACKIIEQMGVDGIDINMGCPAAKIVSSCYGSALMRNPKLAADLVASVVKAVKIPVTVKTRLGWDETSGLISFCKGLEDAGASAFAIHGRRYCDKFTGTANWEPIYELKKALKAPVLGNGDIASGKDALDKLRNLDGVMVGRSTFGNPWVMQEICDAFSSCVTGRDEVTGEWKIDSAKVRKFESAKVSNVSEEELRLQKFEVFKARIPFILEHCELSVRMKGERRGVLEMRRHIGGYIRGFDGAKELRMKLMTLEDLSEVKETLTSAL